jgi:LmbE family N-acetylglucosaminyl deacetylase
MENLLTPYQSISCIVAQKALVLAPHPDDEIFGCGGAIMRHIEQQIPVTVVIVSDGGFGKEGITRDEYVAQRQRESVAAAEIIGYGKPIFWRYRDREVFYDEALIHKIVDTIQDTQSDLVYAPSLVEIHPDHRNLALATMEAVRRIGRGVQIAFFEIGVPLHPNVLVDISSLAGQKLLAMQCFSSQLAVQSYAIQIAALNRYRSYSLPLHISDAEAFMLLTADAVNEMRNEIYKLELNAHQINRLIKKIEYLEKEVLRYDKQLLAQDNKHLGYNELLRLLIKLAYSKISAPLRFIGNFLKNR